MIPRVLWAGEVVGEHWELQLRDVYEGPLVVYESESGEGIDHDTQVVIWHLELVSRSGERIAVHWDPAVRQLGGEPLRGWNPHLVGIVKRHLIGMGLHPRV